MLLREFIYFEKNQSEMTDDLRYSSEKDSGVWGDDDLRKLKLTLRMLNDLRKAGDAREKEIKEELALIRKMYAAPPPEAGAA
jgi:hypothetical protein